MMTDYPELLDFLYFFENDPEIDRSETGFYSYRWTEPQGLTLLFSFNVLEGWVAVTMLHGDDAVLEWCGTGVTLMRFQEGQRSPYLEIHFGAVEAVTSARLWVKPRLKYQLMLSPAPSPTHS